MTDEKLYTLFNIQFVHSPENVAQRNTCKFNIINSLFYYPIGSLLVYVKFLLGRAWLIGIVKP